MSLPRAGVKSDFRRFEELKNEIDVFESDYNAFKLGLPTTLGVLEGKITDLLNQLTEKTSYGVVSGLQTTAQAIPNMTVEVASGVIYMENGERFEVEADTMLVLAADPDNPRIDIIYINGTGIVSYYPGTAAAVPEAPETPGGSQLLAEVAVAANATVIEAANITDKRKLIKSW